MITSASVSSALMAPDGAPSLFVTGSHTGVGKTWVARGLIRYWRDAGYPVAVRKPVETGWPDTAEAIHRTDAAVLAQAADRNRDSVCPIRLRPAVSPERAAALTGYPLPLAKVVAAARLEVSAGTCRLCEGAGGFLSPIAEGALNADLAQALGWPVLIVVPDELGTVNQALLTVEAVVARGLAVAAVVLNARDGALAPSLDNAAELKAYCRTPIVRWPRLVADDDRVAERRAAAQLAASLAPP